VEPPYLRIARAIQQRVAAGELRPGDRVPSTRRISQEWGVAMATATKVLATLGQWGVAQPVPGVGTVVARAAPERPSTPPARAGDPALSADRVVAAAIAVADTEGLAALSMRRVAADLGVATMSLYRHVANKDELLLRMIEQAFARHPLPSPPPDGWRARLEVALRAQWRGYRQHPWLAQLMSLTRPPATPAAIAHTEWVLGALAGCGLDLRTAMYLHISLFSFVRGVAVDLETEAQTLAETGKSPDEYLAEQEPGLAALTEAGGFPIFARMVELDDFDLDLDVLFETGLRTLLDGVARLIERANQQS
jgi:AcrR family transcriptional regulator